MSNTIKKDVLNAWGFLESREEMIVSAAAAAFSAVVSEKRERSNAMIMAEAAKQALEALKHLELTPIEHAYLGLCVAHAYQFFKNSLTRSKMALIGGLGKKGK